MSVVRLAVGCAVAALLAGHQLSILEPARRDALLASVRTMAGGGPPATPIVPARIPAVVPPRTITAAAPAWGGEETVAPDDVGQFQTTVEIAGRRLPVLVDTGATFVALTYEDADRIGLRPMPADFKYPMSTANGRAYAAKVELPAVRLGGIEIRDVTAMVSARGRLGQTLLGMSFLTRLSSVTMDHGRLVLAQ